LLLLGPQRTGAGGCAGIRAGARAGATAVTDVVITRARGSFAVPVAVETMAAMMRLDVAVVVA
jgi:hypothetical protein